MERIKSNDPSMPRSSHPGHKRTMTRANPPPYPRHSPNQTLLLTHQPNSPQKSSTNSIVPLSSQSNCSTSTQTTPTDPLTMVR